MAIQAFERCRTVLADLLDASPRETHPPDGEIEPSAAASRARLGRPARRRRAGAPAAAGAARLPSRAAACSRGRRHAGVLPLQCRHWPGRGASRPAGWPRRSPPHSPASAGCSWSPPTLSRASRRRPATRTRSAAPLASTSCLTARSSAAGPRLRISLRLLDLRGRQSGRVVAPVRPAERRPADAAGRDRRRGGRADRPRNPADRGAAAPSTTAPQDASAYDLVLRAIPLIGRLERAAVHAGRRLAGQAIGLEPDYAAAHAWYAYWHMFLVGQGWAVDPEAAMAQAGRWPSAPSPWTHRTPVR